MNKLHGFTVYQGQRRPAGKWPQGRQVWKGGVLPIKMHWGFMGFSLPPSPSLDPLVTGMESSSEFLFSHLFVIY